jgi:hypothetical protein
MPILFMSPFFLVFVKKENVNFDAKLYFFMSTLFMGLHKIDSYMGKEWLHSPVFHHATPETVYVTFCVTFVLGLLLMSLLMFGEEKRLFFIYACQVCAESHHFKKFKEYPGRETALMMMVFNLLYFTPSFLSRRELTFIWILQIWCILSSYGEITVSTTTTS